MPAHMLKLLSVSIFALVIAAGCGRDDQAAQAPVRPPAMVSVATAETREVPVYLDEIGRTVSVEMVSVIPQVGGKVIAAHVNDGAEVNRGQLLFEIDPRPFQAELDAARAAEAQRRAELELARTEFRRVQDLIANNAVSQLEYDQRRSATDVAAAAVEAAQAQIEMAELNLEYTKIHAPMAGRAGARLVDPGNVVKANEGTMLQINELDPIYAEFTVTENDLGTVRKFIATRGIERGHEIHEGLQVYVDVPGDSQQVLEALGNPNRRPATQPATQPTTRRAGPREGVLTFLDNAVEEETGTIRLRAKLPNSDRYFWPGQFVKVRVVLTTRPNAVLVPAEALQVGQNGPYVYVVTADNTAEMRPVVPGQRQDGNLVVVDEGVKAGEQVVTVGHMMIQPGAKVQIAGADAHAAKNGDAASF